MTTTPRSGPIVLERVHRATFLPYIVPHSVATALSYILPAHSSVGRLDWLRDAWSAWQACEASHWHDLADDIETFRDMTGISVVECRDCGEVEYGAHADLYSHEYVCRECIDDYYFRCYNCSDLEHEGNGHLGYGGNESVCDYCFEHSYRFCDACDEFVHIDDDGHSHGCDCEAPHLRFSFPADGHGTIREDERLRVELPAGVISEQGMNDIAYRVWSDYYTESRDTFNTLIYGVGNIWQRKDGNFTRRLSSACYRAGFKIASATLSDIGNIASAHTSKEATYWIEVTRDLNESAEYFYHDDSCWWGSYAESRCALKSWGGLAIRSFYDEGSSSRSSSGRAWIQPLNGEFEATHDALNAQAFVVYNGYGALSGYVAARIVAQLTGFTYRKIGFVADGQYVNSGGYLVASEVLTSTTEAVRLKYELHDRRDARHVNPLACDVADEVATLELAVSA